MQENPACFSPYNLIENVLNYTFANDYTKALQI